MKSRRMRWIGHVAYVGKRKDSHRFLMGKPEGKRPFGGLKLRRNVILKWVLQKWDGPWTKLIWLRVRTGGGLL
jgi:hypothetical protein